MDRICEAERILRNSGIRITKPRVDVYDYILTGRTHPTCEEIYENLKDSNPSLSVATVYNVTEKLVEEDLLIKIVAPNGERRFDGTLDFHGHFFCDRCRGVFDFDILRSSFDSTGGFIFKNIDVTASGICPDCQKNNQED